MNTIKKKKINNAMKKAKKRNKMRTHGITKNKL